ncbi:MAG TPA: MFS transporter [Terriglobales bacterium]|nr:MFS transporter [Terriglobales bacterium]
MRPPCDEAVIGSGTLDAPCGPGAGPWILTAAILGSSMTFIDSTVVNVALPALQSSLGATVIDVQWVIESYGLFLGALILAGGSAGDLLGRRRVFLAGVTVFAVASAWCGLAPTIRQLIIARALQGAGAAFLVPGSLAIISASFAEKQRGRAIGTWSGFTSITAAMGPVLGGWLIEHASWRWAFLLNLPLAIAVIAISLARVPESRSRTAKGVDWLGTAVATLGLGGLVYGFIESSSRGLSHPLVYASLLVGAAGLFSFPLVEERATSPMVPPELFRSRTFTGANLLTFFLYAALGIFFFVIPLNLIQVQGYTSTGAGAAMLPLILLMFILSRWSGGLVVSYGPKLPLIAGPLIAALGFLLFTIPAIGGSYWTTFFPAFLVLGLGMAVTVAPLTTVVMDSVGQDRSGTASGINNAVARVAGLLAIAVLGIVILHAFRHQLDQQLANLGIAPAVRQQLDANSIKLAALEVPVDVAPAMQATLKAVIGRSFLLAFRLAAWICVVLAVASAACARWLIESRAAAPAPAPVPAR